MFGFIVVDVVSSSSACLVIILVVEGDNKS